MRCFGPEVRLLQIARPAVDEDFGADHEARPRAGEKNRGFGEFGGAAHPADRDAGGDLFAQGGGNVSGIARKCDGRLSEFPADDVESVDVSAP